MLKRLSMLLGLVVCLCVWTGPALGQTWDHLHLTVSDTEEAAKWYGEHFGGKVAKVGPFDAVWFGTNLIKFRSGDAEVLGSATSAVDHIAFSVEDASAKADALREAGVNVGDANRRRPDFFFGTDPWGTKFEILEDEDLLGFHHVHLRSTLPKTEVEWYAKVFGGTPKAFKDAVNLKAIRYGDMYLFVKTAVRPPAPTDGRSLDHVGWRFKDFDATIKKLKGLDVKFTMEATEVGDHRIAYIESPSGVKIEIVEASGE
ncbi:MAG: VOC family protein [Candidatus Hydrogenedentes bacterium]|nr:VOC family protein [Candidatus Hydrogenedentota bacterium]